MLNLISELVDELNLTLVFVSHDLSVVRRVWDRIAVGPRRPDRGVRPDRAALRQPQHPYTQTLINAVRTLEKALAGVTAAELAEAELAHVNDA